MKLDKELEVEMDRLGDRFKIYANNKVELDTESLGNLMLEVKELYSSLNKLWKSHNRN